MEKRWSSSRPGSSNKISYLSFFSERKKLAGLRSRAFNQHLFPEGVNFGPTLDTKPEILSSLAGGTFLFMSPPPKKGLAQARRQIKMYSNFRATCYLLTGIKEVKEVGYEKKCSSI